MLGSLSSRMIRELIASALNVIVQQERLADGKRRITHIADALEHFPAVHLRHSHIQNNQIGFVLKYFAQTGASVGGAHGKGAQWSPV